MGVSWIAASNVADTNFALWRRRNPTVNRGNCACSLDDSENYHKVLKHWLLLCADFELNAGTVSRWANYCASTDILLLAKVLKDYTSYMLRVNEHTTVDDFMHFQNVTKAQYPDINTKLIVGPIKRLIIEYIVDHSIEKFKLIYSFLAYITRLSLKELPPDSQDITDYLDTEERVKNTIWSNWLEETLTDLMTKWFGNIDMSNLIYHHGPGTVAEKSGWIDAVSKYRYIQLTRSQLWAVYQYDDEPNIPQWVLNKPPGEDVPAKLTSVPKNILKRRWICKESTTTMFLQQAVKDRWADFINQNADLSHFMPIRDPERNASLAQTGSITGGYATIDMSDASDTVPNRLIQRIFAGTPLTFGLKFFRSRSVRIPTVGVRRLLKHAPMGSALCWLAMLSLIAGLCFLAVQRCGDVPKRGDFAVYGDDVVIRTKYVPELRKLLDETGFKLNVNKTFLDGPFRESCGGEYLNGIEVTPVRIPRKFTAEPLAWKKKSFSWYDYKFSADKIEAHCALINQLGDKNFRITRRALISELFEEMPPEWRPLFSLDGSSGIKHNTADNFHLKHGKNHTRYQCPTRRINRLTIVPTDRSNDEDVMYWEWHVRNNKRAASTWIDSFRPIEISQTCVGKPELTWSSTTGPVYDWSEEGNKVFGFFDGSPKTILPGHCINAS